MLLLVFAHLLLAKLTYNKDVSFLEKFIDQNFDASTKIQGGIRLKLLPLPKWEVTDVKVFNPNDKKLLLRIKKLSLPFSTSKNSSPSSITLDQAKIAGDFLQNLIKTKNNSLGSLKSLSIKNSGIYTDPSKVDTAIVKHLNTHLGLGSDNEVDLNANLTAYGLPLKLSLTRNSQKHVDLKINNDFLNFSFSGDYKRDDNNTYLQGEFVNDIKSIANTNILLGDWKDAFKLLGEKDLKLTGKVKADSTTIKLSDIKGSTDRIEGFSADLSFYLLGRIETTLKLDIAKIHFENLDPSKNEKDTKEEIENYFLLLFKNLESFSNPNFSFLIDAKIKEISLTNDKINDFHINLDNLSDDNTTDNASISLNNFKVTLPGNSEVLIKGILSNNKIRPKFNGDFMFYSEAPKQLFNLLTIPVPSNEKKLPDTIIMKSELTLIPNNLRLHNIKASVGDLLFLGSIRLRKNSSKNLDYLFKIHSNKFDANILEADKWFDKQIANLYIADYDKSGEIHTKLTDDYRWLRKIKNSYNFEIDFDELNFKGQKINNFDLDLKITGNQLSINNLEAEFTTPNLATKNEENSSAPTKDGKLSFSLALTLPSFRPYIDLNASFTDFNLDALSNILPKHDFLSKQFIDYQNQLIKSNSNQQSTPATTDKIQEPELNFFSANNYDGNIKVSGENIGINQHLIDKMDFQVAINNGLLNLSKCNINAFNGNIVLNGNLAVMTPVPNFSVSYAAYNIKPGELINLLFGTNISMEGYASISGALNSSGETKLALASKMQGETEVVGKKVIVSGFNLGELINLPSSPLSYEDKIKKLNLYSREGETIFDNLKGKISVNGGYASLENFTLDNNRLSGVFAAKYDIWNKAINSIYKFSFIPTMNTSAINIQYSIKGSLNDLQQKADLKQLEDYIKEIEIRKQEEKDSLAPSDKEALINRRLGT